jgi:exodeoxyribonuclease V alpha subunit
METVVLRVARIVSGRAFGTIFAGPRCDGDGDAPVIVRARGRAYANPPVVGETWSVTGDWVDTPHGWQLEVERAVRLKPHGRLIVPFLAARVLGIGPARAQRLWDALGDDLGRVLDAGSVEAVAAVLAPAYPHLSARLAARLIETWQEVAAEAAVLEWLQRRGVDNVRAANRIVRILGSDAIQALEDNPYVLLALLDWKTVDRLGLRLLREDTGVEDAERDPRRLVGAVDAAVHQRIDEGDTLVSDANLRGAIAELLRVHMEAPVVASALELGLKEGAIVPLGSDWRAPGCALLEDELVARFCAMMDGRERSAVDTSDLSRIRPLMVGLDPEQEAAALAILGRHLAVLTGGAGVGKTTTVRAVCDAWEMLGGSVVLCALSGKAAVVLSQKGSSPGRLRPGRTVQRLLLELSGVRDAGHPDGVRLDDRTLLVVDEAGMVGLGECHRLLAAMPSGCRLLVVGDAAQLPPINMGLVFHRLARVPSITSTLRMVRRQDGNTGIPTAAAEVRAGRSPAVPSYQGREDGISFLAALPGTLKDAVTRVVADLGGFEPGRRALQVLSAVNLRHEASVRSLNLHFHLERVSRIATGDEVLSLIVKGRLGQQFAAGDPVIHLRNDYQIGLFNGSLGWVTSVDAHVGSVTVDFDGVEHEFAGDALIDLALAYALTCHKAQGSEAERIVVPLFPNQLLDPSWLYTAITRAERQVVLIGDMDVLREAMERVPAHERRRVGFLANA